MKWWRYLHCKSCGIWFKKDSRRVFCKTECYKEHKNRTNLEKRTEHNEELNNNTPENFIKKQLSKPAGKLIITKDNKVILHKKVNTARILINYSNKIFRKMKLQYGEDIKITIERENETKKM